MHPTRLAATFGGVGAVIYVVCHFWGFAVPHDLQALHADLLRMSVLGWSGMNARSILLGTVQWAAWGAGLGLLIAAFGRWTELFTERKASGHKND